MIILKDLLKEEERIKQMGMQVAKRLEELEKEKANLLREFHRLEGEMNQVLKMRLAMQEEEEVPKVGTEDEE